MIAVSQQTKHIFEDTLASCLKDAEIIHLFKKNCLKREKKYVRGSEFLEPLPLNFFEIASTDS